MQTVVIPAEAGIQDFTGCQIRHPGLRSRAGMTKFRLSIISFTLWFTKGRRNENKIPAVMAGLADIRVFRGLVGINHHRLPQS